MTGRPSTYSEELIDKICLRVMEGESISAICRDKDFPCRDTVYRWLLKTENGFSDKYTRATAIRAEYHFDELFQIADDGSNDSYETEDGQTVTNQDVLQRSRLRIDTRKWALSKMMPKKYGDKLDIGGNVSVKIGKEESDL